jgi:hypothetical protein
MAPDFLVRTTRIACGLAIAMSARPAHAQVETTPDLSSESPPAPEVSPRPVVDAPPPAPTEHYWYGWQTLTADGASLAVTLGGIGMNASPVAVVGVGGLYLAAPAVHLAHGRVGVAFGSLGLRMGLPVLGGVIGFAAAAPCSSAESKQFLGCAFHGWGEAAVGGLLGLGAAVVLDAALLAHGTREISEPAESGRPRVTSVAPSFDPVTRTASVGLGGSF